MVERNLGIPMSPFPKIRAEHTERAMNAIGARALDKKLFRSQVYHGTMFQNEPMLHMGLIVVRSFGAELLPREVYAEVTPHFEFGAAYMYSVMQELKKEGYQWPTVGEEAFRIINEQGNNSHFAIDRLIGDQSTTGDIKIDEMIDLTRDATNEAGHMSLSTDDILSENRGLASVFAVLNVHEKSGARAVYRLVRRQHEINQMNALLGETDQDNS